MKPRTPKEQQDWNFAIQSIGDRIWNNTDMFFAAGFGGICGFCLGMIVWMIVKYS